MGRASGTSTRKTGSRNTGEGMSKEKGRGFIDDEHKGRQ
jgi:hypothetical protein